jgi:hypothetical protein
MAGSDPPSRKGVTYRVAITVLTIIGCTGCDSAAL